jgi:hypothetical protein
MVQIDDKHLELASTNNALTVYITDAKHEPISTVGASGRAIVQADGKTATVTLTPTAPNALTGISEAPLPNGARVVVTATLQGSIVQARFEVP